MSVEFSFLSYLFMPYSLSSIITQQRALICSLYYNLVIWFSDLEKFNGKKKELKDLIQKRKHDQFMKDGTTDIQQVWQGFLFKLIIYILIYVFIMKTQS